MPKKTNFKEILLLIFGGITTGILIGEIGLRVLGIDGYPKVDKNADVSPTIFHTANPDRGWSLKPNAAGWWEDDEGKSYVEINSDGFRDRERSQQKPPNTFRIAVLGDSFAEAIHIPLEKTFWGVLEQELKQCKIPNQPSFEVLNFGIHGYGTAQQLMTLRTKVWEYNPDFVILAFFVGNDIINNSKDLEFDQYRPFFIYDQQDQLVADMSFREIHPGYSNRYGFSWVDRLPTLVVNNSRIFRLLKRLNLEQKKQRFSDEFTKLSGQNYQEPTDDVWKQAWRVTEDLILLMRDEVVEKNAGFFLFTIGDPNQVHRNPTRRQDYMIENGITNFFYPEERLQKFSQENGINILTLGQPFQEYADKNQICLHGSEERLPCLGHWNLEGHRLAGEMISYKMCEILKSPAPSSSTVQNQR